MIRDYVKHKIICCINIYFIILSFLCFKSEAITLDTALKMAYKNSELVAIKEHQKEFSKIDRDSSILGILPTVTANYTWNKVLNSKSDPVTAMPFMGGGLDNIKTFQSASISMRSSLALWKTLPGIYVAFKAKDVKQYEYNSFLEDFGLMFIQTYMDVIYNTKALEVYKQMSDILDKKLKKVTIMNRYGTTKRDKVVLAEAQYYKNKTDEITTKSTLDKVKMDYKIMTGAEPVDLEVPDLTKAQLPAKDKKSFVEIVLAKNNKIKQSYYENITQKSYMVLQSFDLLPEPYTETSFSWYKIPNMMNYRAIYIGLGVSWTINGKDNRLANFRKEYRNYRIADLNYHLTLKQTEQDAEYAWEQYEAMLELVKATKKALKASKDSLQEVKVSVSVGTATFIDEMDVENQYLQANLDYLNSQKALILSYYKIIAMTGVGYLPIV